MRISMITPWGDIRGGIRTYSEHLIDGFEQSGKPVTIDVTRLARFHDIDGRYLEWLAEKAVRNGPDVVHIQHEGARYGFEETALYDALSDAECRVVTTIHSAQQLRDDQKSAVFDGSDKVIVHNDHELRALRPCPSGVPVIVPHGCVIRDPPVKAKACAALGVDPIPSSVALTYGFAGPWKQLEQVIEAVHQVSGVTHVHAGEWHTSLPHGGYAQQVRSLADQTIPFQSHWTGYVDDDELDNAFGLADFAVYANAWASESGSMAEMMGAGVPVIARDIEPFNDGRPAILFETPGELEHIIRTLRDDESMREKWSERGLAWAIGRAWHRVADIHRGLYEYVLGVQDWNENFLVSKRIERSKWILNDEDEIDADEEADWGPQIWRMMREYARTRFHPPVLDVGCRSGGLARYVAEKNGQEMGEWCGIDILPEATEKASELDLYTSLRSPEPIEDTSFADERFNTVIMQDVLEHLPDQRRALSECFRLLGPGGLLVVTMPSADGGSTTIEHMGPLTPGQLSGLAASVGFDVVDCTLLFGANRNASLKKQTVGTFEKPEAEA